MIVEPWVFWAILSAVFAALVTVFAKSSLADIDSDFAQLIRTAVVLPVLAALILMTGKWQNVAAWNGRTWFLLVLSGLATCASWLCYFRALNLGKASQVAALDKLSIIFVAVIAALFLKERIGIGNLCGIGLIAVGSIIICTTK